ncbi:MAG: ATP-binding cassette domain-containing protein [Blautia marasmi]
MNNDIILKAENLFFSYDDENSHSLNGLSLEIKRGQKVAFMGSNGSGKSTFFLCCNGIHRPSSGTLYFNGEPVTYDKKGLLKLRSKIGIVFQDPDNQLFQPAYTRRSLLASSIWVCRGGCQKVEEVIEHLEITPSAINPPTL